MSKQPIIYLKVDHTLKYSMKAGQYAFRQCDADDPEGFPVLPAGNGTLPILTPGQYEEFATKFFNTFADGTTVRLERSQISVLALRLAEALRQLSVASCHDRSLNETARDADKSNICYRA